jgi:hypothetical protein
VHLLICRVHLQSTPPPNANAAATATTQTRTQPPLAQPFATPACTDLQDHLEQQEAAYGLHQPAAQEGGAPGTSAAEGTGTVHTADAEGAVTAPATAEDVETTAAAAATLAEAPRQQQQQQQQQLSASAVQPASGG